MKYLPLILRNVFRNKIRTLFTALSIAISLFLVVTLYSFLSSNEDVADSNSGAHRVAVVHEAGLAGRLPIVYVERVRRLDGVAVAAPMSWFGGKYREETAQIAQFATDPQAIFEVYPELTIPPDQLAAWQKDKTGCVVGSIIARNKGWNIGDKIPLSGDIYPVNLELTVRGIYDGPDTSDRGWILFHFEYFDELLKRANDPGSGNAGIVMLRAASAQQMAPVMQAIEAAFESSDAPVTAMTEKAFGESFLEMIGNVKGFIRFTSIAVVLALLSVAGNTMAMSLRERTREIALLKAVGFSKRTVLGMFLTESVAIGLLGGLIGAVGAKILFDTLDLAAIDANLALFFVPWRTVLWGLALAALVGLLSGIIPAWRAGNLSVVDGLRKVV
ncbi:MAG TPA: FtsX-like permease family protein [Lacipirellulaceae bacterium]|nr:FtsX-like permease family protein [Lacipirellulaceae bacterium]